MAAQKQLKPTITKHLAGHWYWADLQTPDLEGATSFYSALFDWDTQDMPTGDGIYRMAFKDGQPVAAMNEQLQQQRDAGIPPHWFNYLTTDDIDATTAKVAGLGGTVLEQPFDVMDAGRMAIVQDPTGATFALWQAGNHAGTTIMGGEHGTLSWFELRTTDAAKALEFYCGLFDFTVEANDMGSGITYHVLSAGGEQSCGVMQLVGDMIGMPTEWTTFFAVDDVDATIARAKELGATVQYEPHDIPDVGRFSVMSDPQGAALQLFTPLSR